MVPNTGLQYLLLISSRESSGEDKPRDGTGQNDWWCLLGVFHGLVSRFLLLIFERSLHLNNVKENLMTLSRSLALCRPNSLRQIAEHRLQTGQSTHRSGRYENAFHIEPCGECVLYGIFMTFPPSQHLWNWHFLRASPTSLFLSSYDSLQTLECKHCLHKGKCRQI